MSSYGLVHFVTKVIYMGTQRRVCAAFLSMIKRVLLGGSWDLVTRDISTLIRVISNYNYSYLTYNPSY